MKTYLIVAIFAIFAFTAIGVAGENPDSRSSITFGLENTYGSEEHELNYPQPHMSESDIDGARLSIIFKIPMSEDFTVDFTGRYSHVEIDYTGGYSMDYKIYKIGFTMTFYLGSSINK